MSYSSLTVVTTAAWVSKDLASAGVLPVDSSMGLDAPELDGSTALWCSGAFALRLLHAEAGHTLLAAGTDWMMSVPAEFLGRTVTTGPLKEIASLTGLAFFKLSEHKHSGIPAALHYSGKSFTDRVQRTFEGWDISELSVTVSEPMKYRREFRTFIAHGQVTATSFYLSTVPGVGGTPVEITWDAFTGATQAPPTTAAAAFAQRVVDAMGDNQPPGYTLDVGEDDQGRFTVIEANAAWSSNIYHADPAGVIVSILASQEPGHEAWQWKPDQLFLDRSRPLPVG